MILIMKKEEKTAISTEEFMMNGLNLSQLLISFRQSCYPARQVLVFHDFRETPQELWDHCADFWYVKYVITTMTIIITRLTDNINPNSENILTVNKQVQNFPDTQRGNTHIRDLKGRLINEDLDTEKAKQQRSFTKKSRTSQSRREMKIGTSTTYLICDGNVFCCFRKKKLKELQSTLK